MACDMCRSQARSLVRTAMRPSTAFSSVLPRSAAVSNSSSSLLQASTPALTPLSPNRQQSRSFSRTPSRFFLKKLGSKIIEPYRFLAATERLYKVCSKGADYKITAEERKKDMVRKQPDGEEMGHSLIEGNPWHTHFGLQPTFSTWSHVTMLHLYLFNARIRCFSREECRNWQQQMIDSFFFDAEKKMHVDHGIVSSALRQRYLKDIFVQWRGLILAYDEGLVKGDPILASAIWRNLFKASPDVDPRALAAIVGWMRANLQALEALGDEELPWVAPKILGSPVERSFLHTQPGTPPPVDEKTMKDEMQLLREQMNGPPPS